MSKHILLFIFTTILLCGFGSEAFAAAAKEEKKEEI